MKTINKEKKTVGVSRMNNVSGILRERAMHLAEIAEDQTKNSQGVDVLYFMINKEEYGIEASLVSRVCEAKKITHLPCVPNFIEGIINVHGKMIGVINLKNYFGLDNPEKTELSRVIVLSNHESEMGLIVDSISGMTNIDLLSIQTSMPTFTGVYAEYLRGVTNDSKVILDANKLLNSEKLHINDTM